MNNSMRYLTGFFTLFAAFSLIGCSGIAKGITEAVMDKKTEDTRMCEITGPAFPGIKSSLAHQDQSDGAKHTKVLMVHGIGKHLPDYSARFREKLLAELNLDQVDEDVKVIDLLDTQESKNSQSAGLLKVYRYSSSQMARDLIFYELTWSGITDDDKKVIEFDDSSAYNYRRASINKSLKHFMNSTVPDVLAYEGPSQALINKAVGQSVCWMFKADWKDLPQGLNFCDFLDNRLADHINRDDYFVVTHSLGSRITMDTFNNFSVARKNCKKCDGLEALHQALIKENITIFMLANQLPFLQVGRPKPLNTGATGQFCSPAGKRYSERLIGKTRVVAFSDPNDILSYPIPPDYANEYMDSRICPEVVNIDINVTQPSDAFGVSYANPLDAHNGYLQDDRVIKIIANGLQKNALDPLISQRCRWMESMPTKTATKE